MSSIRTFRNHLAGRLPENEQTRIYLTQRHSSRRTDSLSALPGIAMRTKNRFSALPGYMQGEVERSLRKFSIRLPQKERPLRVNSLEGNMAYLYDRKLPFFYVMPGAAILIPNNFKLPFGNSMRDVYQYSPSNFDCSLLLGRTYDSDNKPHRLVAHVYNDDMKEQIEAIIENLQARQMRGGQAIFSPRVDSYYYQDGTTIKLDPHFIRHELQRFFPDTSVFERDSDDNAATGLAAKNGWCIVSPTTKIYEPWLDLLPQKVQELPA